MQVVVATQTKQRKSTLGYKLMTTDARRTR